MIIVNTELKQSSNNSRSRISKGTLNALVRLEVSPEVGLSRTRSIYVFSWFCLVQRKKT